MSSTNDAPARPEGVPPEAEFLSKNNLWWLGETRDGKSVGSWTGWHATLGHRAYISRFDDEGELVHVTRFHPDGKVAQENPHRGNWLHGTATVFRATPPASDPYFNHLPAAIMRLETPMVDGMVAGPYHCFDAEGNELSVTGVRKPAHVPAEASATNSDGDWTLGEEQLGAAYQGVRTTWRGDGTLRYIDWFDGARNWLRRTAHNLEGIESAVHIYVEGTPEAPPLRVIRRPDPRARPIAWESDRKWLIPASGEASSVATYFHADGTRWLEVPHAYRLPIGLRCFDKDGALTLEERWHPPKKAASKRVLASITCHTMSPPRTVAFEPSGKILSFTEGDVTVDLKQATAKSKPGAAWFAECFGRYFTPWLAVRDVSLTFKTVDISSLSTESIKEPFAATTLFEDGNGNAAVVIEEGTLARRVFFCDHEEGAGGLDDLGDFIAEEGLEDLKGDALIQRMPFVDDELASSVVLLLRGIRFSTRHQHFERYA